MNACEFAIGGRRVGAAHPPLVIAELSANHVGSLERALSLVGAAKAAGAEAIKLQTYTAETMTIDHDGPQFRIAGGLWDGYRLYDLYREAHTPWEWHEALFAKARSLGMIVLSTPFDLTAVDFLEGLDCPAYKVASFELNDHALLARIAATGKPMIVSTGMATLQEIADAVSAIRGAGCRQLALLHCVSAYPSRPEYMNLNTIRHLAEAFGTVAGLSDHTLGTAVSVAAVALGAAIVEKHFTGCRADGGPDAAFSLEPEELSRLVADCTMAWQAVGRVCYEMGEAERGSTIFRRSLIAVRDIKAGEPFTADAVRAIRPGYGLPPKNLATVLTRVAATDVPRGTPLAWPMVGGLASPGGDKGGR